MTNSFEEAQSNMISELHEGCDVYKFCNPLSNQKPHLIKHLMDNIAHETFELTKDHCAILFKMFFTTWECTDNQINWLMDVVEREFTKLTGCSLCFEPKKEEFP